MTLSVGPSPQTLAPHGAIATRGEAAAEQGRFGELVEGGRPGKQGKTHAADGVPGTTAPAENPAPSATADKHTAEAAELDQDAFDAGVSDPEPGGAGAKPKAQAGGDQTSAADEEGTLPLAVPLIEIIAAARLGRDAAALRGLGADSSGAVSGGTPGSAEPGSQLDHPRLDGVVRRGASATALDPGSNNTAAQTAILLRRSTLSQQHALSAGQQKSSERLAQLVAAGRSHGPDALGSQVDAASLKVLSAEVSEASGRSGRSNLEARLSARDASPLRSGPEGAPSARERKEAAFARDGKNTAVTRASPTDRVGDPSAELRSVVRSGNSGDDPHAAVLLGAMPAGPMLAGSSSPSNIATVAALAEGIAASHPAWASAAAGHPGAARPASGHSIRLELHPAELGMVTVSLKMVGEQLSIELNVESEEARSRLTTESDSIVKAMRGLGFDVDRVTINQSAIASPTGQTEAAQQGAPASRDQHALFSGQSGKGSERNGREGRDINERNASAVAAVQNPGVAAGDVYI